jgi:phosphate transport system substrate-binding protein
LKLYKKLAISVGLVAGVLGTVYTAGPAGAAVPSQDGKPEIIGAVGSDTIYWVSNNLMGSYNSDTTFNDGDRVVNIPPVVTSPFPTGAIRPFDANSNCNAGAPNNDTATYPGSASLIYDAAHLPPNGSSAGIAALNGDTTGCLNMARSSRVKGASDLAADQFFAFALDALDWVSFPGSQAPANLTRAQIHDIYECDSTTHLPIVGNWNQVGGSNGVIHKYAPQTLSGTYSFFKSQFLGGVDVDQNCDSTHKTTFLEEHDARGVSSTNKAGAILPFSYAQWNSDKAGVTPDLRNGVVLKQLDGTTPTSKGASPTINEQSTGSNGHFDGTRYVHYVLLNNAGNVLYPDTVSFAGVTAGGTPGWVCSNKGKAIILLFGFTPLTSKATGGGIPGTSFCRLNPAAL